LAETATHNPSLQTTDRVDTANKNQPAPDEFSLVCVANGEEDYTVTIPETNGAEYSFDGTNWSAENTMEGCAPGETVTGYKRMPVRSGYNASRAVSASAVLPLFHAKTPTATPDGGSFADTVTVTLSTATAGADIYYTLDGSYPTKGSALYQGPLTLSETATVKAIASKSGMADSEVLAATFTKLPKAAEDKTAEDKATEDKAAEDKTPDTNSQAMRLVKFNVNGGKSLKKPLRQKQVADGNAIGRLPKASRAKYIFKGWYTKKIGGKKITSNTKVTKDMALYAHWQKKVRYGYVSSAVGVWVRAKPSRFAEISGYMKAGRKFEILGYVNNKGKGNNWYRLKLNGKTAWVNARHVTA
ncbi:MAG: chitobiase/beta-hexosaminidase C-terminal domain-containing protein, partial [Clostridiales Family XIII bacterium]|nr:chitobiase/beta-hexosaminidase C-terminal domain-containing protein [Clostridiales Family XIII bacterium]